MSIFKRLFGGKRREITPESETPVPARPPLKIPEAWNVSGQFTQDYIDAHRYAEQECAGWDYYVPYMRMVECGGGERKPAMFIKVGDDYRLWSRTTELRSMGWRWYSAKGYVVLRLSAYFEDAARGIIGCGAPGHKYVATEKLIEESGHKLVCSAFLDPALEANDALLQSWAEMPGVTVIFFVQNNCENMNFVYYELPKESRSCAINQLREAAVELSKITGARSSFAEACEELAGALPLQERWKDL